MNELESPTGGEGEAEMGVTLEADEAKMHHHLLVGEATVPVDGTPEEAGETERAPRQGGEQGLLEESGVCVCGPWRAEFSHCVFKHPSSGWSHFPSHGSWDPFLFLPLQFPVNLMLPQL